MKFEQLIELANHIARIVVDEVLMDGVEDSGSDITIISKEISMMASVAKLRKKDFKSPEKQHLISWTNHFACMDRYKWTQFLVTILHMKTPIYVKMDAPEQLLL